MPAPITRPIRARLESVISSPPSAMACTPAATPYCMKRSMRRASLAGMYVETSKSGTLPAMVQGKPVVSKRVMGPMPLRPASAADQLPATLLPSGDNMPRPVTTTRRLLKASTSGCHRTAVTRRAPAGRPGLAPEWRQVLDWCWTM